MSLINVNQFLLNTAAFLTRRVPKILMYHKFSSLSLDSSSSSIELFEQQIKIISNLNNKGHSIHITVDDGYQDFYEIAYPILCMYKVPAVFYVTTGFINKELWLWYDQIEYLFEHCSKLKLVIDHPSWRLGVVEVSPIQSIAVSEFLKTVKTDIRDELIAALFDEAELVAPKTAPTKYAPCTWSQLKEMEASGFVTVGAHSHSHPILTQVSPTELKVELDKSKEILEEQLGHEVDLFCYPNGTVADYSDEIINQLKQLGYTQAVTAFHDGYYVRDAFHVRRFGGVHTLEQFKKHVYGVEFLSQRVRGWQQGRFKPRMPI